MNNQIILYGLLVTSWVTNVFLLRAGSRTNDSWYEVATKQSREWAEFSRRLLSEIERLNDVIRRMREGGPDDAEADP